MSQHEEDAQKWLGYLRSGTDQYDLFIGHVRALAKDGNFLLADIGTSEEELEELRVKGCKTAAQKWLGYLRNFDCYDYHTSFIGHVRALAKDGNFSLADIGTSEEELEELRVKNCKTEAKKWLYAMRNGGAHYPTFISCVRALVKNGNFSLADIGTSEEELSSFARVRAAI